MSQLSKLIHEIHRRSLWPANGIPLASSGVARRTGVNRLDLLDEKYRSHSSWEITMRRAVLSMLPVLVFPCVAVAQQWSAEQQEVWTVIQAQWAATMEKDATWPDRFLHDDFLGWGNDTPAPRGKSSEGMWSRYEMENTTTLVQELYPIGIVVQENTAVAHYFYSTASENRKDDRETTRGRYTDVLVKEGESWRFIAWHGGDDPDNDS